MNRKDYINEANRQLSKRVFYQALSDDPTSDFKVKVKETLSDLFQQELIDENTFRSLMPQSPVAGRFYLLQKIHNPGKPGRPIVSGIQTVTENLSRYVYQVIKPIPPTLPSYIKENNHFLSQIVDLSIPSGSLLVSFYTNIPHTEGIRALSLAYGQAPIDKPISVLTLRTLLKLILDINNFEFNGNHYVQVSGTSMGTRIGPNYANIFMGILESEFLENCTL